MNNDDILQEFKSISKTIAAVDVGEEELILTYQSNPTQKLNFQNLKKVTIITTDEGPFDEDVFWLMLFDTIIMIPQGYPGEEKLLSRLQKLKGFNNENVIKAMSSTQNNAFEVYSAD